VQRDNPVTYLNGVQAKSLAETNFGYFQLLAKILYNFFNQLCGWV
jgi:hypothetical protein